MKFLDQQFGIFKYLNFFLPRFRTEKMFFKIRDHVDDGFCWGNNPTFRKNFILSWGFYNNVAYVRIPVYILHEIMRAAKAWVA